MANAYEFDTQTFGSHLNNNFHWKRFVLFTFTVNMKYIIHFSFNDVWLFMYSSENILFLVRFQSYGNRLINRWKGLQWRACIQNIIWRYVSVSVVCKEIYYTLYCFVFQNPHNIVNFFWIISLPLYMDFLWILDCFLRTLLYTSGFDCTHEPFNDWWMVSLKFKLSQGLLNRIMVQSTWVIWNFFSIENHVIICY